MRFVGRPVLGAAVCLLLAACSSSGAPSPSTTPSAPSSSPTSSSPSSSPAVPGSGLVEPVDIEGAGATRLEVPGGMDWIVTAGRNAWTSNEAITQLDGRSGAVVSTIAVPGPTCLAPAVAFRSLWFGVCDSPQMVRVDVATGKVQARIPISVANLQQEASVAAGAGGVWVLSSNGDIVSIDPRKNVVARVVDGPEGASALRASADAVWATVHENDTLLKLDPRTLAVTATVTVGDGPQFLAVGEGSVWTLDQEGGTVTRVDLRTSKVLATIKVDSVAVDGGDIAVGGGFVWARVTDQLVAKIDPRTDTVVARYAPPSGSGGVAADASAAWITAHDSDSVYRLPLT